MKVQVKSLVLDQLQVNYFSVILYGLKKHLKLHVVLSHHIFSASLLPQSDNILSRHSSGGLNNLSESGNSSGSDSESESTSTDSEGASRAPTPEV